MLFLFPSVGRGSHLRLARGAGPCRCAPHSHPPNPASFVFHPPDPPIALQSISRDAPFSQGGDGETHCSKVYSNGRSKLACFSSPEVDSPCLRLARGAARCHGDRPSHPPSPASFVFHPPDPPIALQSISRDAPFSQGGDGETQCLKVHSGRSPGWIKFTEPSGDTALRFAPRVSSEGLSTSTPKFAEPFHRSLEQWLHVQPYGPSLAVPYRTG